jgi:hypothetical protein
MPTDKYGRDTRSKDIFCDLCPQTFKSAKSAKEHVRKIHKKKA